MRPVDRNNKKRVLLLEDSSASIQRFDEAYNDLFRANDFTVPFDLDPCQECDEAYWRFIEYQAGYDVVICDFNLKGSGQLDGIGLALAFGKLATHFQRDIAPLIIGYSGITDLSTHEKFLAINNLVPSQVFSFEKPTFNLHDNTPLFLLKTAVVGDVQSLRERSVVPGTVMPPDVKQESQNIEPWKVEAIKSIFAGYDVCWIYPMKAGYSGAEMLYVRASRDACVTTSTKLFVVKFAHRDSEVRLDQEMQNYIDFAPLIRDSVPRLFGMFDALGDDRASQALLFEFEDIGAGDSNRPMNFAEVFFSDSKAWNETDCGDLATFGEESRVLRRKANKQVIALEESLRPWHLGQQKGIRPWRDSPTYRDGVFTDMNTLVSHVTRLFPVTQNQDLEIHSIDLSHFFPIFPPNSMIANPLHLLLSHDDKKNLGERNLACSIVHGDLHPRNILQRCDKKTWAIIDFEDVCLDGHVAMDMATMECKLKFWHADSVCWLNLGGAFLMECKLIDRTFELNGVTKPNVPALDSLKQYGAGNYAPDMHLLHERIFALREPFIERVLPSIRDGTGAWTVEREYYAALFWQTMRSFQWLTKPAPPPQQCRRDAVAQYAWLAACLAASVTCSIDD